MKKLFFIILCISASMISAQVTPDKIVDIKVNPITKTFAPGSTIEIELVLIIKNGWHINADKPLDKNLIPTLVSLKDTSAYKIEKIEYPQPVFMNLAFSEDELALYEGEAVVKLRIKTDKKLKKDKLNINGMVQYQPCNDQTCLFPYKKSFSAEFKNSKK